MLAGGYKSKTSRELLSHQEDEDWSKEPQVPAADTSQSRQRDFPTSALPWGLDGVSQTISHYDLT